VGGEAVAFFYATGITVLIYIILGLALNLLMGYAGQLSMAHAAFFGIGAYTGALLVLPAGHLSGSGFRGGVGWGHGPALVAAVGAAFGCAALISVPARRVQGEYLILLTIAFQIITNQLMISWTGLTGGPFGLAPIPPLKIDGKDFIDAKSFFWLLAVIAALVFAACWGLGESPFGRMLKGLREDETAMRALGKNVARAKVIIFGIAAGIAGGAGALAGFYYQFIAPDSYTFDFAMFIVAIVALGGSANLWGTVLGAVILGGLPAFLQTVGWIGTTDTIAWQTVIYGLALAVMMILRPGGLLPEGVGLTALARRLRLLPHPAVPSLQVVAVGAGNSLAASVAAPARSENGARGQSGSWASVVSSSPSPTDDGANGPDARLKVDGLSKRFGGIVAADGIEMVLRSELITALIGPNGAGKTTLFNLVTGTLRPDSGSVRLDGREITGWSPERIVRRGMTRSFQDVRLFQRISALDNVALAIPNQPGERVLMLAVPRRSWRREREVVAQAMTYLDFVGAADHARREVATLSFAEQKMVAIARLLATECDVLLLDEPTSGVDAAAVEKVTELVVRLRDLGKTICLVEHSVHVVEQLADYAYFLDQGRVIAEGTVKSLTSNAALSEVYFGI
jgi:branched-chain amino acid transport system permease protein